MDGRRMMDRPSNPDLLHSQMGIYLEFWTFWNSNFFAISFFDEVDGKIVGISGDLFRTFIWCQSVIGNFAKYVMTTCIPSSVLKKLKTKSLNWW
jgi:hypothetical protein